jgi:D-alanyl-D-alanine carboxypeptidase/D-alanyl-D-alanine-endopeptidase (penicillin-binding protein 4)
LGLGFGAADRGTAATSDGREAGALGSWLDAHLEQPRFRAATWGIKIASLKSGLVLFERGAEKLLKPASNAKLFSAALALDRLGPEFRIRTSIHARTVPNAAGELSGDLLVYGRGSPAFAARFHDGSHADNLGPVARAIAAAGIKRITGNLIADESYFRGPPLGSGWMLNDLVFYYGTEVSALTVEDNVVDLVLRPGAATGDPVRLMALPATDYLNFQNRAVTGPAGAKTQTWIYRPLGENIVYLHGTIPFGGSNVYESVTVHGPARWFGHLLRGSLERHGVVLGGTVQTLNWLDRELAPWSSSEWREIAHVDSPPLGEILAKTLKPSQNLYAQLLLLQVGARVEGTERSARTTEEAGLKEMEQFLAQAGVGPGEVLLEEGSGLSRGTLLTPNATVQLLTYMNRHRHRDAFRAALPLAGVEGTLRRRMKGTAAAQNARAKTGTLRYVYTLSGYVTTRGRDELAYSLMLNNFDGEEEEARRDLDAIVVRLAELD